MSAARPTRPGGWSVVAALVVLTLAACTGGDPAGSSSAASTAASPSRSGASAPLPLGKDDLVVSAGEHSSPDGFTPAVGLVVPEGWTSVHRETDAFDLGRPDPQVDAPLVAVVFLTPQEGSAQEALDAVRGRVPDATAPVPSAIGTIPATSVDLTGGQGQLVASRGGGVALDAAPGQRVRVYAAEVAGAPLLVVVLVPDARRWRSAITRAEALLAGTSGS